MIKTEKCFENPATTEINKTIRSFQNPEDVIGNNQI
jgi:hypothetical protein